jgi:hypothetical protein
VTKREGGDDRAPHEIRPSIVALRWPADADEAKRLAALGVPRLLLVQPGAEPPAGADGMEVWMRLPTDRGDIEEQFCRLAERAVTTDRTVRLDGFGRLFVGQRWIALSEIQVRLIDVLLADLGEVVSERRLLESGWPERSRSAGNLRVQVYRLRTRLLEVGLELRTIRGRGLVLQRKM